MSNEASKDLDKNKVDETIDKDAMKKQEPYTAPAPNNPPIKMTVSELVNKLRKEVTTSEEYWELVYRLSDREHMDKNPSELINGCVNFSGVCAQMRNADEDDVLRQLSENAIISAYKPSGKTHWYYRRFSKFIYESSGYLKARCSFCSNNLPACIYRINTYIKFVCYSSKISEEEVYKQLQGKRYKKNESYECPMHIKGVSKQDVDGLDFFTVIAAMIMLKNRWITCKVGILNVEYTYIDVISHGKTSIVEGVIGIYSGNGIKVSVPKKDIKEHAFTRNMGAHVKYQFHPERVAAYMCYLAEKYNVSPVSMASYVGRLVTNEKWGVFDTYKVELNRQKLKALPMNKEDSETTEKMFNYIINRYFNSYIPFIPINMVIYSEDDKETEEMIEIFRWVCNYYYYFNRTSNKTTVKEISIADYSMSEIVKLIDMVEFPHVVNDKDHIPGPVIFHIKDFHLLPELDNKSGDSTVRVAQLQNALERQSDKVAIIISGPKDKLSRVLEIHNEFYKMIVDKHITLGDMSSNQIVYEIMHRLDIDFDFEDGFERNLKEYVYLTYKKSKLKSKSYIEKVVRDISFLHYDGSTDDKLLKNKDIPTVAGFKSDKDIWEAINALEGLDNVKEEMRKLQTLLSFRRKTMGRGIALADRPNLHMVFQGNPGTGKTTVARLLADLLFNFGYLKENKIIEVSPKDLVAQFVGQTAPKTAAVCQAAYGGILFIDEAYELANNHSGGAQDAFRSECVTELIKQMEDHRDNLVVIFAGYTKDMEKLMESNAGLASRVGTVMEFEDYTEDQLLTMFKKLVNSSGMVLNESAENVALKRIRDFKEQEDFGNGRFVRNLYEKTITQHAYNTIDSDEDNVLSTITEVDIADMGDPKKANSKYHIGFV